MYDACESAGTGMEARGQLSRVNTLLLWVPEIELTVGQAILYF